VYLFGAGTDDGPILGMKSTEERGEICRAVKKVVREIIARELGEKGSREFPQGSQKGCVDGDEERDGDVEASRLKIDLFPGSQRKRARLVVPNKRPSQPLKNKSAGNKICLGDEAKWRNGEEPCRVTIQSSAEAGLLPKHR
jgi:hypothetical protein